MESTRLTADAAAVTTAALERSNFFFDIGRKLPVSAGAPRDVCATCGGDSRHRCGGCQAVTYCSAACQKSHWKAGHKAVCQPPPAPAPPLAPVHQHTPKRGPSAEQLAKNHRSAQRAMDKYVLTPDFVTGELCYVFQAVCSGNVEELKYALFRNDILDVIDKPWSCTMREHAARADVGTLSALSFACAFPGRPNAQKIAQTLVDLGADLHHVGYAPVDSATSGAAAASSGDRPRRVGTSPLSAAANSGNVKGVRMLLQAGADPNFNSRGQSAFACFEHCTEDEAMACARLLIAAGGDPSAKNCENDTPLHTAIMRNQVRLAKLLLDEGKADINAVNCKNMRPFDMCTTRYGKEECLKLLLDRGANTSPRAFTMIAFSGTGTGSVNATVRASQLAGQRVILDGGVSVGTTWPDFVAQNVDLAVIVLPLLLRPQRSSGGSDQPLMLDPNYVEAAAMARPLLSAVLAHPALTSSAKKHTLTVLKSFLAAGVDVNKRCASGRGPLWYALRYGHAAPALLLMEAGALPLPLPPNTVPVMPIDHILKGARTVSARRGTTTAAAAAAAAASAHPATRRSTTTATPATTAADDDDDDFDAAHELELLKCGEWCVALRIEETAPLSAMLKLKLAPPAGTVCSGCHHTSLQAACISTDFALILSRLRALEAHYTSTCGATAASAAGGPADYCGVEAFQRGDLTPAEHAAWCALPLDTPPPPPRSPQVEVGVRPFHMHEQAPLHLLGLMTIAEVKASAPPSSHLLACFSTIVDAATRNPRHALGSGSHDIVTRSIGTGMWAPSRRCHLFELFLNNSLLWDALTIAAAAETQSSSSTMVPSAASLLQQKKQQQMRALGLGITDILSIVLLAGPDAHVRVTVASSGVGMDLSIYPGRRC